MSNITPTQKTKSFSLKSIMRNDKLRKVIFDGYDAPLGSTKRQKARGILNSLTASRNNFNYQDGQGGTGYLFSGSTMPTGNLNINLNPQNPTLPVATKPAPIVAPGMGTSFPSGKLTLGQVPTQNKITLPASTLTQPTPTTPTAPPGLSVTSPFSLPLQTLYPSMFETPQVTKPKWDKNLALQMYNDFVKSGMEPASAATKVQDQTGFSPRDYIEKKPVVPTTPVVPTETKPPIKVPSATEDTGGLDTEDIQNIKDSYGTSGFNAWKASLDPSQLAYYQPMIDDIESGKITSASVLGVMSSKEKLKHYFPDMPDEVIAKFPQSGLLADMESGIINETKQKYNLDSQYKSLVDLQNRGMNIEQNLTDYIKGKDEYLNTVDQLLNQTREKVSKMDTSNPYIAQRMNSFVNYLTILEGRQQNRYIDFLKLGIDSHNNEITQAQNTFNMNAKLVNDELAITLPATEENFNNIKTALTEMYNSVSKQEEAIQKNEKFEWEKAQAWANIAKTTLESQKIQNEIGGAGTDYLTVTNPTPYDEMVIGVSTDTNGNISFNNYNPYQAVKNATQAGGKTYNPNQALDRFYALMGKDLTTKASSGSFLNELNKFKSSMANDVVGSVPEMTEEQFNALTPEQQQQVNGVLSDANKMQSVMESSIRSGLSSYLLGQEQKINDVRAAIKDLIGEGWTNFNDLNKKTKFTSRYYESLKDLAPLLFDTIKQNTSGTGAPKANQIYDLNSGDDELAQKVISDVIDYIMS